MGCSSCSTGSKPGGCKSNGDCLTDRCGKLEVFDWLSNFEQPSEELRTKLVEIRFKNDRKEFFINSDSFPLKIGDRVAVEAKSGHDMGIISITGELVKIQMRKKHISKEDLPKIYRLANEKDMEIWQKSIDLEKGLLLDARVISKRLQLNMKISDTEVQGDGTKAIIYYTSENRIDFRQLIREYAAKFKLKIEMKQIGYRQEAAKIGGIGSCGRELCCSTWLTDFRSVSTSAARYQQLSINPEKLQGQCGKLKCCLNFELDSYLDAIKKMPSSNTTLKTVNGKANCVKIDVFKEELWFAEAGSFSWHKFSADDVRKMIATNKKGGKLKALESLIKKPLIEVPDFTDLLLDGDIKRFENKKPKKKKKKKKMGNNRKAKQSGEKNLSNPRNKSQNKIKSEGEASNFTKKSDNEN